ncbi:MAG: hypothetical protein ACM33T_02460 [Solirubrobacterales bacterium]
MRMVLVMLMMVAAHEAAAADFFLVQWKKTHRCEVVVRLPVSGDYWTQLAVLPTRWQAVRKLEELRRMRTCPPAVKAEESKP